MANAIDILSAQTIRQYLVALGADTFRAIQVLPQTDSTNNEAKNYCLSHTDGARRVWLAEQQTAGRGRLGRSWYSPKATNIYLTVVLSVPIIKALQGLSLVVGVAVVRALKEQGMVDLKLKWPNDILHSGKKLGGILIELLGGSDAVIGIGLNVRMPALADESIDQPWTDISQLLKVVPERNALVASLLHQLAVAVADFNQNGLSLLGDYWQQWDAFAGANVVVKGSQQEVCGQALGIDSKGRLRVKTSKGIQFFDNGDVSLRLVTD